MAPANWHVFNQIDKILSWTESTSWMCVRLIHWGRYFESQTAKSIRGMVNFCQDCMSRSAFQILSISTRGHLRCSKSWQTVLDLKCIVWRIWNTIFDIYVPHSTAVQLRAGEVRTLESTYLTLFFVDVVKYPRPFVRNYPGKRILLAKIMTSQQMRAKSKLPMRPLRIDAFHIRARRIRIK